MRRPISLVTVGLLLAACSSSSNPTSTEIGPVPVSPIPSTTPSASTTVAGTTGAAATTTTSAAPSAANATAQLPDPLDACQRLEGAVATFSPIAEGQDPPGLVPAADGSGNGCSMTWQEHPPNSTLLRANLLFYTKEKMTSETEQDEYACDQTPDVVPGWPDAFTCNRMSTDGPASLIWLDKDGQSVSLSIRGNFIAGFTPQDVANILVTVLGPNGTVVTVPTLPPVQATIATLPPTTSAVARLPSESWNGMYVVEPVSGALQIGQQGSRVKDLQRNLGAAGLLDPPFDGYFGPDTEQAVVDFQRQSGLRVDGIANEALIEAVRPG